jgi:EAL domain-containing protein (putative c-di-GMP-specific phosphodiesterase class I)
MDEDEKSAAIVKTILMLGENLGIEVVAEGIETEHQLELLRKLGCRLGQGYIFSEPVDSQNAEALLVEPFVLPVYTPVGLADSVDLLQSQEVH